MLINRKSPHGGDVYTNRAEYDFSANINPFGMPEPVKAALLGAIDGASRYPDPYCTALREKLSEYEGVPAENIVCGGGAAEVIYQFAYSLPKDRPALTVSPTFCEYEAALSAASLPVERYALKASDGFALTGEILEQDFSRFSAVFVCSPNNPTGITVRPELLWSLAGKCRESATRLFCDFCFLDLSDTPEMYDIPRLVREYPEVFVLRAFTKSFAMAGVRLGWGLCSDGAFLKELCGKTQCWNVSVFAQAAGIAAAENIGFLSECRSGIRAERERLKKTLRGLGVTVYDGEANYLLLYSSAPLLQGLYRRGILVRDCQNYAGLGCGYIRTAVRSEAENTLLLENIEEILHEKS